MNAFMVLVFILAVILGAVMIVGVITMINEVTKQVSQINVADMVKQQVVCGIRGMLGLKCD